LQRIPKKFEWLCKTTKQLYEFGPYRLDVDERLLMRTWDGAAAAKVSTPCRAGPKQRAGGGKDELMQSLCRTPLSKRSKPDAEHLATAPALSGGRRAQYIETIPKRGYRFVAMCSQLWRRCGSLYGESRRLSGSMARRFAGRLWRFLDRRPRRQRPAPVDAVDPVSRRYRRFSQGRNPAGETELERLLAIAPAVFQSGIVVSPRRRESPPGGSAAQSGRLSTITLSN